MSLSLQQGVGPTLPPLPSLPHAGIFASRVNGSHGLRVPQFQPEMFSTPLAACFLPSGLCGNPNPREKTVRQPLSLLGKVYQLVSPFVRHDTYAGSKWDLSLLSA